MVIRGSENRGRNKGLFAEGGDPCLVLPQFLVRKEHSFSPFYSYRKSQTIGLARIGGGFCFKPLVWPKSGSGFASNHWFGSNRRWVLLQTTWFGLNRGRVLLQTTWFDPNRGCVSHQTTWFDPNRGCVSHQTTWFGSNRGRVLLQTIWFDPNRGRVLLQTTWFDPNRGRFCFKPPGLTPIGVGFASKAISILGLVRAESKDPAPARGGTGP